MEVQEFEFNAISNGGDIKVGVVKNKLGSVKDLAECFGLDLGMQVEFEAFIDPTLLLRRAPKGWRIVL